MSLSFADVGYTYDAGTSFAVRALAGVDLEFEPHALTLVLGATGSGKSTLLRLAAGLITPTEGVVSYGGEPVTGPLAIVDPPVGMVFQSPESQLFAETVLDDVSFGPKNRGLSEEESRAAAFEALASVGLDPDEFAERSPFSLSGGEARRTAIAGIVAMHPGLLLFDEPTAGLDASGRDAVRAIVSESRARAGVVVVTHDAEEFLGMADRVVLLHRGSVAFDGRGSELIAAPGRFAEAGLRVPEVLRAQMLAVERGVRLARFSMEPAEAARIISEALVTGR